MQRVCQKSHFSWRNNVEVVSRVIKCWLVWKEGVWNLWNSREWKYWWKMINFHIQLSILPANFSYHIFCYRGIRFRLKKAVSNIEWPIHNILFLFWNPRYFLCWYRQKQCYFWLKPKFFLYHSLINLFLILLHRFVCFYHSSTVAYIVLLTLTS